MTANSRKFKMPFSSRCG